MNDIDLSWVAGIIEADGWIGEVSANSKNQIYPIVGLGQHPKNYKILDEVERILSGKYSHSRPEKQKKKYWNVHWFNREALRVIRILLPFLKGDKKYKANNLLIKYINNLKPKHCKICNKEIDINSRKRFYCSEKHSSRYRKRKQRNRGD